jgi:neutral ceramidase
MPNTRIQLLFATWLCLGGSLFAAWQAGVAKADITPTEPVPLAGYGGKTRMSQRIEHPIWLKALAFRDDTGSTSVIVTADLVGLSDKMIAIIAGNAEKKHHLPRERLILNTSHNHSCPVTEDVLWLYYEFTPEESAARDRYTAFVYAKYDEVIGAAIAALQPAELSFEQGLAGVAVNRRRSRGAESRSLGGQIDQDVPVIAVKSGSNLRAILFGYSCHTTALGGLSINGDYAGFAQLELEKAHPGCIALFVQNCGGDANPLPRIRGRDAEATTLAAMYGHILAESVQQVLAAPMTPLSGPLRVAMGSTDLSLQPGLPLEELQQRLPALTGMPRREFEHFIRQYETLGSPPDRVRYPIQVWSFGPELTYIALTGETVVDYSLHFKAAHGWNSTWVSGYNNDLLSYIPSLRVLKEGGYEGTSGMYEYGHRAPYTESVEERITTLVEKLLKQIR